MFWAELIYLCLWSKQKKGKWMPYKHASPRFMYYACQDHMAFSFWHKSVACSSLFGKWTHLGNGIFQACVCLQYTGKIYCPNTLHDYWRNNSLHFLARGWFLGRYHRLTEMLVGRDLWRFSLQLKAELLPALGQVSHVFCSWAFKTHSKDGDSTSTLISLSNCFPDSSLNLSRHNLWPLPIPQLGISYFQEIFDSVVFVIPLGIVVGCYLIASGPPLHPRCLSVSFR